jgi:hypothetical protein
MIRALAVSASLAPAADPVKHVAARFNRRQKPIKNRALRPGPVDAGGWEFNGG